MLTVRTLAFALALAANTSITHASEYVCRTADAQSVDTRGQFVGTENASFRGKTFTVDTITGRMEATDFFTNHNANGTPEVLDKGSDQQAFKVVTRYRPLPLVDYLQINVHVDEPDKPFLFFTGLGGLNVYSGLCRRSG